MKKTFSLFVVMLSFIVQSQNTVILKKDGSTITIQDRPYVYGDFGSLRYYLVKEGTQFEKGIDFEKVEKVTKGDITYIPLQFEGKGKYRMYKIIADASGKQLLVSASAPPVVHSGQLYVTNYTYQIIDADKTLLASGKFQDFADRKKKNGVDQKKATAEIKKHFSNCATMLAELATYEKSGPDMTKFYVDTKTNICD